MIKDNNAYKKVKHMSERLLKNYIKNHFYYYNKVNRLFETFLNKYRYINKKNLLEISKKIISQDYQSAKEFIEKFVKSEKAAFYCLDLLMENLSSYTRYLEISEDLSNSDVIFRLKQSFLNKREKELTNENVKSFIEFTIQCIEILLSDKPYVKSAYKESEQKIVQKIEQENI